MLLVIAVLFLLLSTITIFVVLKISSLVDARLNQMNQSLQQSYQALNQNLGATTNVFGSVKEQLGRLEVTNNQILETSKNISSLQELLRAPKFRGQLGETLLENILAQVLPKQNYQVQYRFKSADAVDAIIRVGERLVPVDAKFSLENFQKMVEATDEQEKQSFRKKFIQDVKNRIDEIASKYILPLENTYDFALMYIPAENVYYEVIVKEDLVGYFSARKVIPVSPNTLYAYLQVICVGLKGMQVEENAKEILKALSGLTIELAKFRDDFDLLGKHLSNAGEKFDDSRKRLERFSEKLNTIHDSKAIH